MVQCTASNVARGSIGTGCSIARRHYRYKRDCRRVDIDISLHSILLCLHAEHVLHPTCSSAIQVSSKSHVFIKLFFLQKSITFARSNNYLFSTFRLNDTLNIKQTLEFITTCSS